MPIKTAAQKSTLGFEDILSHVATLYRRSLLVPFIGSGMSLPACASWNEFLRKLALEAGVDLPKSLSRKSLKDEYSVLSRLADVTVSALRPLPYDERSAKYRDALRACAPTEAWAVPPQTEALAASYWPLVLTTNYDDLYWGAASKKKWGPPIVLGRRLEDCYHVLRSLDEPTPPILWALQGFLGGQSARPDGIITDPKRRQELINQLVVGHQQYQRVINAEEHFRRAFAEVFRRRSLLFIGSGLLEDYLVNLFGEIIHYHGPGPHTHFALLNKEEEERFDPWFLQNRLGIVPVFYEGHACLPDYLERLAGFTTYGNAGERTASAIKPDEIAFTLDTPRSNLKRAAIKIRLCKSKPPHNPGRSACSVMSAGRKNKRPVPGPDARELFDQANKEGLMAAYSEARWEALDKKLYVFRYNEAERGSCFFAVAARRHDLKGQKYDPRDLGVIPEAIYAALRAIDKAAFETVHVGPIASSYQRPWHPIHPFVQVIRGVREFISRARISHIRSINLHVEDPSVWYPVLAGKIPIAELLSSDLATHKVELTATDGNTEVFTVTLRRSPTLDQLLKQCRVKKERWVVEIFPAPMGEKDKRPPQGDMVITPTMTVTLKPNDPTGEGGAGV